MQIHHNINAIDIQKPVVTVGSFDGVHAGHKRIIATLQQEAEKTEGASTLFTFNTHPRLVLKKRKIQLLNTIDEKIELLRKTGLQHLVIHPFTPYFARFSSVKFIEEILVNKLNINKLIVGYDHRFGYDRGGDTTNLYDMGKQFGFAYKRLDALSINGVTVSSSIIRKLLTLGDIETANSYLSYSYYFSGKVINGNKIGRKLGFPTANIQLENRHKLIPDKGVYAVDVEYDNHFYKGMLNIGFRPTVAENEQIKTIEVHIFDFNKEIYSEKLRIILRKKIRDEKKFENTRQLQNQLSEDKQKVIKFIGS